MYTVWRTGHSINERVVADFCKGTCVLSRINAPARMFSIDFYDNSRIPPPSISYGFLRGAEELFQDCMRNGVEWWEIDRGYFKPHHFDGYYRISLEGVRASYTPTLKIPKDRWEALKIPVAPWKNNAEGNIILCPPTDAVCVLYKIDIDAWIDNVISNIKELVDRPIIIRHKGVGIPDTLDAMLDSAYAVVTFNSNVAIAALLKGIPAFILDGSNQTPSLEALNNKRRFFDRKKLFAFLAYSQFTLEEFRSGKAWFLAQQIQKYGVLNDY